MKNNLKHYTFIGILFVSISGTLSHFVYEWSGKKPFLALFFRSVYKELHADHETGATDNK